MLHAPRGRLPIEQWHAYLRDSTPAAAILDRPIRHALRLVLTRESMRKQKCQPTAPRADADVKS
jgi:hypothetical protein